jgi:hypothetical protein
MGGKKQDPRARDGDGFRSHGCSRANVRYGAIFLDNILYTHNRKLKVVRDYLLINVVPWFPHQLRITGTTCRSAEMLLTIAKS